MTKSTKPLLVLFGGTFDPIHYGHLNAAWQTYQHSDLIDKITFIVNQTPPHKENKPADADHRVEMVKLCLENQPEFAFSDCELKRKGPSYTIDTILAFKASHPDHHICLLIGEDSFLQFHTWRAYEDILANCHLIVVKRPEIKEIPDNKPSYEGQIATQIDTLSEEEAGFIYFLYIPELEISATYLRNQFEKKQQPRFLLPDSVLHYIIGHGIYSQ